MSTTTIPAMTATRIRAEWEADRERLWAKAPAVPTCPSWCVLEEGHAWDGVDDVTETFVRTHVNDRTDLDMKAFLSQDEQITVSGEITHSEIAIATDYEVDRSELNADAARQLAIDLENAADLLDWLRRTSTGAEQGI